MGTSTARHGCWRVLVWPPGPQLPTPTLSTPVTGKFLKLPGAESHFSPLNRGNELYRGRNVTTTGHLGSLRTYEPTSPNHANIVTSSYTTQRHTHPTPCSGSITICSVCGGLGNSDTSRQTIPSLSPGATDQQQGWTGKNRHPPHTPLSWERGGGCRPWCG